MKPNKLGGHTVEPHEIGVVRNALKQVNSMLGVVDEETADNGDAPVYTSFARGLHIFGVPYALTKENVAHLARTGSDAEFSNQDWELTISETPLVLASLKWIADPENKPAMNPLTTSAAQIEQARSIVAEFEGRPAPDQYPT